MLVDILKEPREDTFINLKEQPLESLEAQFQSKPKISQKKEQDKLLEIIYQKVEKTIHKQLKFIVHDRGYKSVKTTRKASLPKRDDKPIFGLVSTKNYILANKVENMLARKENEQKCFNCIIEPKVIEKKVDWVKKKDYGAVPKYLEKLKEQMQREYDYVRTLQQQEQEQQESEKYILTDEEIKELREGLKTKWDFVNKKYQLLTHKAVLDTIGLRRRYFVSFYCCQNFFRKEEYEKELSQIEKDIEKLNKGYIFVDSTQQSQF